MIRVGMIAGACCFALLLHACGAVSVDGQAARVKRSDAAQTFVFVCNDGFEFVARTEKERVWLFLPSGTLDAQKTSTDTFRATKATFRLNGESALLEQPNKKPLQCGNDRRRAIWEHAKLNGADFRAIGNEPGWNLEIRNQSKIVLVTDYGSNQYDFDLPAPETDSLAGTTRYAVDQPEQKMILKISGEMCRDSMSDEVFESKVEVILDGKVLHGCGRPLH